VSWQLGAFALLTLALAAGFAWYERARPDARIVALVGTLAAFAALGRIAFAAVPNVKPTTDIVLISGYALGGGPGFAVGALAALTSNFFFGQGPWTPWQMAGWGVTGVIGAGLAWLMSAHARPRGRRRAQDAPASPQAPSLGRWPLAIVCCVVGFGFTALQDVGDWMTYSDHSWAQLGAYVGAGLGFDAVHAAGCLVFALAIGPALIRSVQRFTRRLQVQWIGPGGTAPAASPPARGIAAPLVIAIVGLAALGLGPAASRARAAPRPVAAAAASYLLASENADGGFGQAPHQPSSQLYAGWAALGLASAGYDLDRVAHGATGLVDYLRTAPGATADVGSLERTILVVRAAGLSARSFAGHDLVAELQRRVAPDGAVSGQVNLTSFAILALRAAGLRPRAQTLRWLAAQQDHDGGFSFGVAGGSSDVDDTGAALEALAGDAAAARVRTAAVTFLRRQQDPDGGFPSQPGSGSNAQSTAWAIQGLDAAGVPAGPVHRDGSASPLDYLDSLAAPDGQIRYSRGVSQTPVWVTGEALMALEGKPLPLAAPAPHPPPPPPAHPSPGPRRAKSPPHPAPTGSARAGSARGHAAPAPVSRRPSAAGSAGSARRTGPGAAASATALGLARLAGALGLVTAIVLAPLGLG
jgi:energy-coupling factor transport system substrate-specific component